MITFFWPWLLLLIPLPLLVRRLARPVSQSHSEQYFFTESHTEALQLPDYNELRSMTTEQGQSRSWHHRLIVPWLIWVMLVISAAQPLWLDDKQPIPVTGRDLMLLLDVSGSMRQMDFTRINSNQDAIHKSGNLSSQQVEQLDRNSVSRLEVVKQVAAEFVQQRKGDRTGLILFGDKPYLRAALSYDRNAIRQLIFESEIALAGESTAIGDAVGLAIKRMRNLPAKSRVIVLLTDGANNEGMVNPGQAAQLAAAQNIKIYTIGIGKQNSPGPNPYGIWSADNAQRFEKSVLQYMAKITGGHFFHALDSEGIQQAYDQLNMLEPNLTQNVYKHLALALYPWTLVCALILSVIRLIRSRRLKTKVFN